MGGIEWAMWGNEQGIASSLVLLVGGILAVIGKFKRWEVGAYAIVIGVLILLMEYPRSRRAKGRATTLRRLQSFPATMLDKLGPVGRNYYFRFVIYLLACVPSAFQLSTVLGALSLLVTSIIYLKAAINGEKWLHSSSASSQSSEPKEVSRRRPPSFAPPRLRNVDEVKNESFTHEEEDLYMNVKTGTGSRI